MLFLLEVCLVCGAISSNAVVAGGSFITCKIQSGTKPARSPVSQLDSANRHFGLSGGDCLNPAGADVVLPG